LAVAAASSADRHRRIRQHGACKQTDFRVGPPKPRSVATAGTADKVSRATPSRATPVNRTGQDYVYAARIPEELMAALLG